MLKTFPARFHLKSTMVAYFPSGGPSRSAKNQNEDQYFEFLYSPVTPEYAGHSVHELPSQRHLKFDHLLEQIAPMLFDPFAFLH